MVRRWQHQTPVELLTLVRGAHRVTDDLIDLLAQAEGGIYGSEGAEPIARAVAAGESFLAELGLATAAAMLPAAGTSSAVDRQERAALRRFLRKLG